MYFEKPGPVNTEETLQLAFEHGRRLGLDEVVVASTKGQTAYKAMEIFEGFARSFVSPGAFKCF
jgi:hypothetical protein